MFHLRTKFAIEVGEICVLNFQVTYVEVCFSVVVSFHCPLHFQHWLKGKHSGLSKHNIDGHQEHFEVKEIFLNLRHFQNFLQVASAHLLLALPSCQKLLEKQCYIMGGRCLDNESTRDLSTKAKYFAAAIRHALRRGGVGLTLVLTWLIAACGVASMREGVKQRSRRS